MADWIEPASVSVPGALKELAGGHPLVAETLARRGIGDAERARGFLYPDHYSPSSPLELPGMAAAIARLRAAIENGERVCVWGDFDVDGQTATTLLVETLTQLGADVFHHIPVRADEGHGVNITKLKDVFARGADLVLTCDTGIASHEPLAFARMEGVDVIVTDHHTLPEKLPEAVAMVNPQMLPTDHPLRTLPGAGVAYKLAEGLFDAFHRSGDAASMLDLVALGIVADVAELRGDTRYLLQLGLKALQQTERVGLKALFRTAGIDRPENINEETIGFALGPRLNALGRLGDANEIVEFLTTSNAAKAGVMAEILEGQNDRRRNITDQIYKAALEQLQRNPELLQQAGIVLSQPNWHPGIIGIVAARLVEQFGKPAILIAIDEDGIGRGSGRSVEGVNITGAIASQADRLLSFGGHPMAAGLAIQADGIEDFRHGFVKAVELHRDKLISSDSLAIDGYLRLTEISESLVEDLDRLGPFGAGNPPLVFAARNLVVRTRQVLGRTGEHLRIVVKAPDEESQDVVWWRGADQPQPEGEFDLAFSLRMNDFQGRRRVQVVWRDARLVRRPVQTDGGRRKKLDVVDCRAEPDPTAFLQRLQERRAVSVWGEAQSEGTASAVPRDRLLPAQELVIWTAPPDAFVLARVLDRVRPERVYMFAHFPETMGFSGFMKRLAGLCKYALSNLDGRASLERLAGQAGHSERTVSLGLDWLSAAGHYDWTQEADKIRLLEGAGRKSESFQSVELQLKRLLEGAAAYRGMFAKAPSEFLIESR